LKSGGFSHEIGYFFKKEQHFKSLFI